MRSTVWMRGVPFAAAASAAIFASHPVAAEPTEIMVRALAADAKFIGTSMGGMRVTMRDVRSGDTLASGTTEGPTGDTDAIMQAAGRSPARTNSDAAGYLALIDIDEPTLVELTVEGPLEHPGSATIVTARRWVMPGQDVIAADGWVIEVPGIVITPKVAQVGDHLEFAPTIELMCGCPITADGLWRAEDYTVEASLWQEGVLVGKSGLSFASDPGGFLGRMLAPPPGHYRLVLHAKNIVTGNSGVLRTPLSITY